MVDDERGVGMPCGELRHEREQMGCLGAHVEREPAPSELGERPVHGLVEQELRIRVAVHEVTQTDDRLVRPSVEQVAHGRRLAQRSPRDDADDGRLGPGDTEHVVGVGKVVGGLHQHDLLDTCGAVLGTDVVDREDMAERDRVVEPRVIDVPCVPDVDVGIDDRRHHARLGGPSCSLPEANTSSSRRIAVCRCVRIACAAASGWPATIASAITTCSGVVAAA